MYWVEVTMASLTVGQLRDELARFPDGARVLIGASVDYDPAMNRTVSSVMVGLRGELVLERGGLGWPTGAPPETGSHEDYEWTGPVVP